MNMPNVPNRRSLPDCGYRVWFFEEGLGADIEQKFCIDNLPIIPRVGEFIDNCGIVGGWVSHIQYNFYNSMKEENTVTLVINVYLSKDEPK